MPVKTQEADTKIYKSTLTEADIKERSEKLSEILCDTPAKAAIFKELIIANPRASVNDLAMLFFDFQILQTCDKKTQSIVESIRQ